MTCPVYTISPGKSVLQAAEYMQELRVGGLPVIAGEKLVGIITSKDVRFHHPNRIVADSMTRSVITCNPDDTLWEAAELLNNNNIERLPVIENGKLVGIITKSKVMKNIGQLFDSLTEIYNSSYIYHVTSRLLAEGREISIILFDVNKFGELNKRYGHVCGDKCLKIIAQVLKDNTDDDCDYICRYGGDEFVIVSLKSISIAEELASNVIDIIAIETRKAGLPVTVSAGISCGSRKHARDVVNCYRIVENLINIASLASTRAKLINEKYLVGNK